MYFEKAKEQIETTLWVRQENYRREREWDDLRKQVDDWLEKKSDFPHPENEECDNKLLHHKKPDGDKDGRGRVLQNEERDRDGRDFRVLQNEERDGRGRSWQDERERAGRKRSRQDQERDAGESSPQNKERNGQTRSPQDEGKHGQLSSPQDEKQDGPLRSPQDEERGPFRQEVTRNSEQNEPDRWDKECDRQDREWERELERERQEWLGIFKTLQSIEDRMTGHMTMFLDNDTMCRPPGEGLGTRAPGVAQDFYGSPVN